MKVLTDGRRRRLDRTEIGGSLLVKGCRHADHGRFRRGQAGSVRRRSEALLKGSGDLVVADVVDMTRAAVQRLDSRLLDVETHDGQTLGDGFQRQRQAHVSQPDDDEVLAFPGHAEPPTPELVRQVGES
jgi:hypothetical protein